MPVIRVSNETYQKLLKLQAEDGNTMSIFMDRLIAKLEAKLAPTPPPKPRRAVQKPRKIPALDLIRDYDQCPKCGVYYKKGTRGHICDTK